MTDYAVRTDDLTKEFGSVHAIQDLNLHVRRGEIYGFLGPNGAGKSTTLYLLLGLLQPTSGTIDLFGSPLHGNLLAAKRQIGMVAEESALSVKMTGWELVGLFAALNGVDAPEARMTMLFKAVELWDARHRPYATYSRGMRQKLSLIRALVHEPALLILDEPVSGLDPLGLLQARKLIEAHRDRGGTVLISSHTLSEIERSADRVGILHEGRLLIEDTIDGLRQRLGGESTTQLQLAEPSPPLIAALRALPSVERVEQLGETLRVHGAVDSDPRAEIFRTIVEQGGTILEMHTAQMTLEEAFVTITHQNVTQLAGVS